MTTLADIFNKLFSPNSVWHWPYLVSAVAIAFVWLRYGAKLTWTRVWQTFTDKSVWSDPSNLVDLVFSLLYLIALAGPAALIYAEALDQSAGFTERHILSWLPSPPTILLPTWQMDIVLGLVLILASDLATYLVHRAMHRWTWLWRVHAVHHGATQLTFLTTHRQHPLEPLLLNLARGCLSGLALVLFLLFFPQTQPINTVWGLSYALLIYSCTVNLHHCHIPVHYPRWLSFIVMSPHAHHIHHSQAKHHWNRNFGVVFPYWDRLFGTYLAEPIRLNELSFGLGESEQWLSQSIIKALLYPLPGYHRITAASQKFDLQKRFKVKFTAQIAVCLLTALAATYGVYKLIGNSDSKVKLAAQIVPVASFQLQDRECRVTHLVPNETSAPIHTERLNLTGKKPFLCQLATKDTYSCESQNSHMKLNLQIGIRDVRTLVLSTQSKAPLHAKIVLDLETGQFHVASIRSTSTTKPSKQAATPLPITPPTITLSTELCTGTFEWQ